MAQIFHHSTNTLSRLSIFGGIFIIAFLVWAWAELNASTYATRAKVPVEQPVPFSHEHHVGGLGIDCRYCHTTVERSGFAQVPPTETCMNCHAKVKEKSEKLAPVRESYKTGNPVEWIQIHRLPDYVYFNHRAHVSAGVSCVTCHGRIDQMVEVHQVQPLNMAWCLDCHRNPAPNLRPTNLVTKLDWVADRDPEEIGKEIIAAKNIHPPVNCSGCHR